MKVRKSYAHVKRLGQGLLTILHYILMTPAQRPRSEVRRSRGIGVLEFVRKSLEVGKFSKLNAETSQAGCLIWEDSETGR